MKNGAYTLALLAALVGLVLLTIAGPDDSLYTSLGSLLMGGALLLVGLGKGLVVLGYVQEGAAPPPDQDPPDRSSLE